MTAPREYPSAAEVFSLIAETKFEPFTYGDWQAFMGCESENPYIGYNGEYTIVIDGDTVNIIAEGDEYGGELYHFKKSL